MRTNLVDESHAIVKELVKVRKDFRKGDIEHKQARILVGAYNVSCRAIDTTIRAERFVNNVKENLQNK